MDRYGHLMDGLDDQIAVHLDTRAKAAAPQRASSAPRALSERRACTPQNAQKPLQCKGFRLVAPMGFEPTLPP